MAPDLLARCTDLLYREAAYLDEHRWAEWLELYTEDAEFWVPAWDEDGKPTNDPQSQLSLIYYDRRAGSRRPRVAHSVRIVSGVKSSSAHVPFDLKRSHHRSDQRRTICGIALASQCLSP